MQALMYLLKDYKDIHTENYAKYEFTRSELVDTYYGKLDISFASLNLGFFNLKDIFPPLNRKV